MDNPYNSGRDRSSSVLGPTLTFKGELRADEDLLIRGKIEGSIRHSSNLKIGSEGRINAEVDAEYIEVHGEVKGNLTGSKSVVVRQSANVSGNITSPNVSLHEGAKFNGSIDMSGDARAAADKPPSADTKASESSEPGDEPESKTTVDQPSAESAGGDKKSAAKRAADAA